MQIFFHYALHFDLHLTLRALNSTDENETILPHSHESFISFTYGKCEVKDSLQFLEASLDEASKSIPKDDPYINSILEESLSGLPNPNKLRSFIREKGLFPYDELTSAETLKSRKEVFPIESFHNDLVD